MTLLQDQERRAHIALSRFGLGGKPGSVARIRKDAKAALEHELNNADIALINQADLPNYVKACQAVHTEFAIEDGIKEKELTARLNQHMKPEIGFVERLVLFFSNHFSMSVNKDGAVRATIGQLERDVIRKNVLGSFKKMLIGVMQHPAMIRYLDNDDSIGEGSVTGLAWGAGHNQNLAREILELHTMGVGSGYTEEDIDNLAKVITGWSFVRGYEADDQTNGGTPETRGQFIFRKDWHEPGSKRVVGVNYGPGGIAQGEEVLGDLARHPATAQFIAFKLVRHFITDEPTSEMVKPLAAAFRKSGGNLKTVAQALIDLPEAWSLPLTKLRTPYELQVAEMRALDRSYDPANRWPFNSTLSALRHNPWERVTPDGYPEDGSGWISAGTLAERLRFVQAALIPVGQTGHTDAGTLTQAKAQLGVDYRLRGRLTSTEQIQPSQGLIQRYNQVTFEMVNVETSEIVWTGLYQVARAGADDVIYR